MNDTTYPRLIESRLLAGEKDCALASLLVEGLPNSVLVQLVRTPLGEAQCFSLYSVYREETVTFDAIYRFSAPPVPSRRAPAPTLAEMLWQYLLNDDIKAKVLDPLIHEVEMHFGLDQERQFAPWQDPTRF